MKKIFTLLTVLVLLVVLSSCSNEKDVIVIASKPMTEQYIIVEMMALLIEQETDLEVDHLEAVGGGTSNIHPAMLNGEIDIYPEYTGTGWLFVLKQELINDPTELYNAVKSAYMDEFNIAWTGLYGFNNTYGIAMPGALADEFNIDTYSDLAALSSNFVFGAEYDFYEREDGFPGLDAVYGFDFDDEVELDIGLKYQAISQEEVDLINVFSTDGRLEQFGLKVLEDDKFFFPTYFGASLVRQETLDLYPELLSVLEMMTGLISDAEMTYMNYLVEVEKMDPKDVARDFLVDKGVVS